MFLMPQNHSVTVNHFCSIAGILTLVAVPPNLYADDKHSHSAQLEEVIVTAQRREQNMQDIAASVNVISQQKLHDQGIASLAELGPEVPSLVVTSYNPANPQYFIRGVGSTGTSAGEDASVSVFVDGVYVGRGGTTSMDFFDLQRVEILRGPQGTLFGRNAAGGVIQLVSQKPLAENSGYLNAYAGSHNGIGFAGAWNAVLSQKGEHQNLLSRVSFINTERDGYLRNSTTGSDDLGARQDQAARWHLQNTFSENTRALLSFNYAESETVGASMRKASTQADPLIVAGFIPIEQPSKNLNQLTLANDGFTHRESSGVSLNLQHDTKMGRFESISASLSNDYRVQDDVSAVGLIVLEQEERADQKSQEFRMHSLGSDPLQWTLGVYFLEEDIERLDVTDVAAVSRALAYATQSEIPDEIIYHDQKAENQSQALYGQVEYSIHSRWEIILGARYTEDKKRLQLAARGADPLMLGLLPLGAFSENVEQDFQNFSTQLGVNGWLDDDTLLYAKVSQGYKAGGFDGKSATVEHVRRAFEEELAETIEIGFKAQYFYDRLRINSAVFSTDYQDLQVFQVTNTGLQFIDNAASASLAGAELELEYLINDDINTELACAWLQSQYDEFVSAVDDNMDGLPDDLAGNTLTRAPKQSCSVALAYTLKLPIGGQLDVHLAYNFQDEIYITPQNRPYDTVDAFDVINLSLRYRINDSFNLQLNGLNLGDERYKLHTYDADPRARDNLESSTYAEGRHWKLTLQYRF